MHVPIITIQVIPLMVTVLVECAVKWMNAFPAYNGLSSTMSPAMIVQVKPKLDFNQKRLILNSYEKT